MQSCISHRKMDPNEDILRKTNIRFSLICGPQLSYRHMESHMHSWYKAEVTLGTKEIDGTGEDERAALEYEGEYAQSTFYTV